MTSTPNNPIVEAFVFCVEGMAMVQMYLHTMEDVFAREEVAKLKVQVADANRWSSRRIARQMATPLGRLWPFSTC